MKRIMMVCLLVFMGISLFGASEQTEMFIQLFTMADTTVNRLGVIRQAVEANLSDGVEFYAAALDGLVSDYPNVRGNQEIAAADDAVRILGEKLGDAKHLPAAGTIWRVYQAFSNPIVKGDMLVVLGRMGATDYLPQAVQVLQDLNLEAPRDRLSAERIAYGAIISLENFRDASGYLPVFFASTGWYSDRIKSQAAASLPRILEDPTEPLSSVIQSPSYGLDVKLLALQTIESSWVEEAKKSQAAVLALGEGWRSSTTDRRLRANLITMRKLAIGMIRRYGTEDEAVYPLLDRSYREGADEEERYGVVACLAALKTDDAVRLLVSYLTMLNERLIAGILTPADERMVRTVIPALGETGHADAATALRIVQTLSWTNAVKRIAADALSRI